MKIKILGSGTSTGVPEIGCGCPVCTSTDYKDKRLRTSALIETDDSRILIDCGPDFRQQVMPLVFDRLDGVLITHDHYDHVSGLDDLRPFSRFGEIPIYVQSDVANHLRAKMPYCFVDNSYPGAPKIFLNEVSVNIPFFINQTKITPIRVFHGNLPILGYRINNIGYITDMKDMPDEAYQILKGVDVLILNALRVLEHPTHQNLEDAIEVSKKIGARKTYLIHMSHHIGLHQEVQQLLPEDIILAWDGLTIEV